MIDDSVNQTARRVAIHQAIDRIVDARRQMGGDAPNDALSDALAHLSAVALDFSSDEVEKAWQALAAIAQVQLEQAMEDRAT